MISKPLMEVAKLSNMIQEKSGDVSGTGTSELLRIIGYASSFETSNMVTMEADILDHNTCQLDLTEQEYLLLLLKWL